MTKRNIFTGLLPAALLALASCGNDIEPTGDGQPVAARVTASIGALQSRVAGTQWESGDTIGISGTGSTTTYSNEPYATTDGGNSFTAAGKGIFFQNTASVAFNAYYPWSGNGGTVAASTENQAMQKRFDFLYAGGVEASSLNPGISFIGYRAFRHCMTRLVVSIKAADNTGYDENDIKSGTYAISGIRHNGMFDTATGEAKATGTPADDWTITATPADANGVRTYSMILFPQSEPTLKFKAVIAGRTYEAEFTPELLSSRSYHYTITVKEIGLSVSGCTIQDWNGGVDYSGETEVVLPIGKKPMEQAATGDYYFSDGSFADKDTELSDKQKAACIGIVFHAGYHEKDDSDYSQSGIGELQCRGYVVALTDTSNEGLTWGPGSVAGTSTDQEAWNGYKNQRVLATNGLSQYPAAQSCAGYGAADSGRYAAPAESSGWYLPSFSQLMHLYNNSSAIKTSMEQAGGTWFATEHFGRLRIIWNGRGVRHLAWVSTTAGRAFPISPSPPTKYGQSSPFS